MKARFGLLLLVLPCRSVHGDTLFAPGEGMQCNAGIASVACQSWDSFAPDTRAEVVIPCGKCVEIVETTEITVPQGIDIQGRLRLAPPQGSKITVKTGSVLVQGILSIDTPYAPSADETVNFIMTDKGSDFKFKAFEDNSAMCQEGCNVGRRPIVVAGGRLDINGLPESCATWKQLESVSTNSGGNGGSGPTFKVPAAPCSLRMEDETFDEFPNSWAPFNNAWVHAINDTSGTYLEATNRHQTWQGIAKHLDDDYMSCVDAGIPYFVTFKVKLGGVDGAPSACASAGQYCPYIGLRRRNKTTDAEVRQEIARGNQGAIPRDDEWFSISGMVTFTEDDLASEPYYRFIFFEGPKPGESIAIDSFSMWRADSTYFPTDTCSQLIVNGDAELDQSSFHPYPVRAADKWRTSVTVQKDGDNQFFHVTGRKNDWATIRADIAQDCLAPQQAYTFSLKAKSTAKFRYETRLAFITKKADGGDQWNSVSIERNCYTGENQWAECAGSLTLDNPKIFEAHEIFIDIRTDNAFKTFDMDFDDLDFSFATGSAGGFVVDGAGVSDCWTPGSKVLLTSDTLHFEDDTIATIASVDTMPNGKVSLSFEETLKPLSSAEDGFPVELALLERNVKFESDDTGADAIKQGGHLMIFKTNVSQVIDGVELYKFGQRGNLGRYPLHFHMCSYMEQETYLKRNLIHFSNQRCTVIHGTHGVNIEGNVAYENFGHCFMLEDGGETLNRFIGNLAAIQRSTEEHNLVRDMESDNRPSAFWITHPNNTFIGNVAAGGEHSGFWLELLGEVKLPSKKVVEGRMFELPLTEFRDNIAHSHRSNGLRSYPSGYRPKTRAVFENTMSYKNKGNGVFFHNSWNLKIAGGTFADNRRQIQIHRADDIHIEDATIIGETQSYVDARNRVNSWRLCSKPEYSLSGITIHSFLFNDRNPAGPTLKNVTFSNINAASGCGKTAAIAIHDDEVETHFNSWTKLEGVNFEPTVDTQFSMCDAVQKGLQDVVIESVGGALGDGFITSKAQDDLTNFLPPNSCSDLSGVDCAQFCTGACLRPLRFLVDPHGTENMELKVTAGSTTIKLAHSGLTHNDATRASTYRVFSTVLPSGNYTMRFLENGAETWPGFVREDLVEAPACWSGSIDYTLNPPAKSCDVLVSDTVRNGNFESGDMKYWQHLWTGVQQSSPGVDGTGHAGMSKTDGRSNIGQHMDVRCMVEGDEYEITARVRSVDSIDGGSTVSCDPNSNRGGVRCSYATVYSEFVGTNNEVDGKYTRIAYTLASNSDDEWKTLHGVFRINEHMSKSDRVFFYIEGGPRFVQVDDVTVKKFDRTGRPIILNGDFEMGDNHFWTRGWSEGLVMTTGVDGGTAITTTLNNKAIIQHFVPNPLEATKRYLFEAQFKIDGGSNTCEPETWWGTHACPKLWINSRFKDSSLNNYEGYQLAVPPYVPGAWNRMYGYVDTTQKMLDADDYVRAFINNGPTQAKVILDNVSLVEVARDCSELIVNGDGETGDARAWRRYGPAKLVVTQDSNTGNYAIANVKRERNWAGLEQLIDTTCMVENAKYVITANMKLMLNGQPFDCMAVNRCPTVVIEARFNPSDVPTQRTYKANSNNQWVAGAYNQFSAEFTVDSFQATADNLAIAFRNPTENVDMYLDDVSVALV